MLAWEIISVALAFLCVGILTRIWRMKRELRKIKRELEATRDKSYNPQVGVDLFDRDLADMMVQLNKNLDYQKQLKLEAEKAERSIRQSVSDIAHDLRTPLTVMKGNLQMLQMEETLSEKGLQYVDVCVKKADEMREMADDFFQLSVLESDAEAVELKRVDMTEKLLQFLVTQEAVIRARDLEPQVSFPEKSVFVLADEKLVDRMFGNLLNNVLRHAVGNTFRIRLEETDSTGGASGAKERESAETRPGECTITFLNEVGDPKSLDVQALFDRTYRGSRSRSGSGAGLGLYIVKLLAEKQKGHVSALLQGNTLEISVKIPLSK